MGVKISALPPIASPALSDVFPVVQSGVTYKETVTQLSALISSSFTGMFADQPVNTNITSMTGLTGYLQAPLGIKDASGNILVAFANNGTTGNYLSLQNSSAGTNPDIVVLGSDTDRGLSVIAKGAGAFFFDTTLSSQAFTFRTGTAYQHDTAFTFTDSANACTVTWPDFSGTVNLTVKTNGTEAANAVTASGTAGVITTSSLTSGTGTSYSITWTNTFISSSSVIMLSYMGGTNTVNDIQFSATAGSGTSALVIYNNSGLSLNGTVKLGYVVIP